jgi:hypothetical protein
VISTETVQVSAGFRMKKAIVGVAAFLLFGTLNLAAQSAQVFKGQVCVGPAARTASLEKGQTTVQCDALAKGGARYVLSNPENKTVYQLDHQGKFKVLAGENVLVSGTLDNASDTIHVATVTRVMSSKVMQARSVYIVCDACPRGMAAAWWAAFQSLTEWGRFDVTPDPHKADLILWFSANPYLGDYLTRDGPDTRMIAVKITFMAVIDPNTGESLWDDSRQWGSWFVAEATTDLILEFKAQLALAESQNERLLFLLDKNGDGKVSKQEFLEYMSAEFDRLDVHRDGELDASELEQLRVVNVGKLDVGK